jgi:hypothetical protein
MKPIYVYNRRVTEEDVRRCMDDSGDLARYDAGRISQEDAYRATAAWLRNLREFVNPRTVDAKGE